MRPDRFQAPAELLRRFAGGRLDPADPAAWAGALAGIHPASLPLCCLGRNLAFLGPLRRALEALGLDFELVPALCYDTIVAWSPLTYAVEVDGWTLRTRAAALPDQLLSIRSLAVAAAPRLVALGAGWELVGSLQLADLPALADLGAGLEVYGDLVLSGLPALRQLDPRLRVHGNLTIAGCPTLAGLPAGLRVGGAIWVDRAGPGFRVDAPELAGRIVSPWPGLAPRPAAIAGIPGGALALASA